MRFFGRGQDNRATGSNPRSSHPGLHVMHWPKRKELMQKACWIHGLGTAAWIWQGFCLSLCLEPCHTSASSSGLTGKICDCAGEPWDTCLISLWFFQNCCCISHLKVYFIDLYATETQQHLEELPVACADLVQVVQPPENLSSFAIPFFKFFSCLLFPIGFPKGKGKGILGQRTKRSIKTSVHNTVFWSFLSFLNEGCEMFHSLILRSTLAWLNPLLASAVTER